MADMRFQVEDSWMTFHDARDSVASSFPPWTAVLGAASRTLLASMTVPLLVAH